MKTLLIRLLVAGACMLIAGTSMAEVARITGKTCKDHLRAADLDSTEAYQLNQYYKDAEKYPGAWKVRMGKLEVKEDMHSWAKKHILQVQNTIATCEQHCKGLKFVSGNSLNCKAQLPVATGEQLHHLIRSEVQLKDDALGDIMETPKAVAISGEKVGADETSMDEGDDSSTQEKSKKSVVSNTLDNSYFGTQETPIILQKSAF